MSNVRSINKICLSLGLSSLFYYFSVFISVLYWWFLIDLKLRLMRRGEGQFILIIGTINQLIVAVFPSTLNFSIRELVLLRFTVSLRIKYMCLCTVKLCGCQKGVGPRALFFSTHGLTWFLSLWFRFLFPIHSLERGQHHWP